jgi:hypothetical protein
MRIIAHTTRCGVGVGLGAHASAVISGHAIYVTLAWAALAVAAAVTVLAARSR